jgi:THO complex subunit 1
MFAATTFSLDGMADPLASIAKNAIDCSDEQSLTVRFDTVETALRNIMLDHCEATWDQPALLVDLLRDWKASSEICTHLLVSQKMESCRKLPFVILEDVVEALFGQTLKDFWTQAKPAEGLCRGVLWAPTPSNSHVLQFIKSCNRLLKRFKGEDEWVGLVMLDLARVLPLTDKSSTKIYGSVYAGPELVIDSSQAFESNQDYPLYQSFWTVQRDFANPYKIDVGPFVNKMRVILAGLEGTSNQTTHSGSLDYLTAARLFPVQLQDSSLKVHVLTQFLIIEAFLSTQSPNWTSTLQTLAKRAKDLLIKIGHGDYLTTLDWLLTEREEFWRSWKQNKCKPEIVEVMPAAKPAEKKEMHCQFTNGSSNGDDDFLKVISMTELATVSKEMGQFTPDVFAFLEDYKDALDPEAGIEAEYHPKNDKLLSWRAMRLLGKKYLGNFNLVQKGTGDFENLVRHIYKTEKNVDIPGQPLPAERGGNEEGETEAEQKGHTVTKTESDDDEVKKDLSDVEAETPLDADELPKTEATMMQDDVDAPGVAAYDDPHESVAKENDDDDDDDEEEEEEEEETEEVRELRYAGMDPMQRAMAEEEDQLERDNRIREKQEARKRRQQEDDEKELSLAKKKAEEEEAARVKLSETAKTVEAEAERKRKRSRSSSPGRDVRQRQGQSMGATGSSNTSRGATTDISRDNNGGRLENRGKLESRGGENRKEDHRRADSRSNGSGAGPNRDDIRRPDSQRDDSRAGSLRDDIRRPDAQRDDTRSGPLREDIRRPDTQRGDSRSGPLREDNRRPDTQRDDPRGVSDGRSDFREGPARGDQRREQGRDDRRGGFKGQRDGEYRRR